MSCDLCKKCSVPFKIQQFIKKKKNLKTFPSAVTVLSEVFKENVNKHLKLT